MTRRRGLPPVRISSGLISCSLAASPLTTCHRRRHSSVASGSKETIRNSSKNGCSASSRLLKRLVAVASSMIWGSDCNAPRNSQPKFLSTFPQSACRFSTMRTSFLPSRAAASKTAARPRSARASSCQRVVRSACVSRKSPASVGSCLALSRAR